MKTVSKKKKRKKAKWLSEEALQIAEKRREVKGKGEKERCTYLNAEFQRTARRDKKAFLNNHVKKQKKTIEWERLEVSSRNERYQGNTACKDGHNKGQKWYGPDRSKILRRGDQNTQKNYTKKILMTQIITMV